MQFKIQNMTCGGCASSVTKAIHAVDPTAVIETDTAARLVTLKTTATASAIQQALQTAGYPAVAN